jgi:polysaccharide biosynthesis/export protein
MHTARLIFPVLLMALAYATPASAIPTIQPGQVLKITVANHPEFSQQVTVGLDGTVDYPLLAGVPLEGLSASEVRDLILPVVMRFEREPEIYVVISQVQMIKAQVYGAVKAPGKFEAESPLNLQQLLGMAGGFMEEADIVHIRLIRSERQGRSETVIDLTRHFFSDSLAITPNVEDGDMVVVPRLTPSTSVRVFGLVRTPGEVFISTGDNIYDIILRAGGFEKGADTRRVLLISGRAGNYENRIINLNSSLKTGRISDLPLPVGGDMVIVPELEDWRNLSWWLTTLKDVVILTSSLLVLSRIL